MIIGAQGYTIRDYAKTKNEVKDSFQKLAKIGFTSMQYSGMAKVPANWLRDIALENKVKITVTHSDPIRILQDTETLIAEHKIFGCSRIGIGSMPIKYRGSIEGVRSFIRDFTPAAKKMAKQNMKLHYHNHAFEYEKIDGVVLYDLLVNETPEELFAFIPDTYWIQVGGRCPAQQIKMLENRVEVVHFKDMTIVNGEQRMAPVLEGNLCWNEIIGVCKEIGVKHAVIEQDDCYNLNPFECLSISYNNLRKLGL